MREGVVWCFREVARTVCTETNLHEARGLAAARDDPSITAWLDGYLRQRRSIFEWTEVDAPGRILLAAALVDCFDLLPELFTAVRTLLGPDNPRRLRQVAASAAAMLVKHPQLAAHRSALLEYHLAECADDDPYHRASMLLGAGELDGAPRGWLDDPHLGVRVCAALAPALGADADAIAVLVSASQQADAFDAAFGTMLLPQLAHHAPTLVEAVCRRVADFGRLVDSAVAAVPYNGCYLPVGGRWRYGVLCEPYLRKAFPDGLPRVGAGTAAQHAFAYAVAAHEPPWRGDSAWLATFNRSNLPRDRSAWLAFANATR